MRRGTRPRSALLVLQARGFPGLGRGQIGAERAGFVGGIAQALVQPRGFFVRVDGLGARLDRCRGRGVVRARQLQACGDARQVRPPPSCAGSR